MYMYIFMYFNYTCTVHVHCAADDDSDDTAAMPDSEPFEVAVQVLRLVPRLSPLSLCVLARIACFHYLTFDCALAQKLIFVASEF